MRGDNCQFDHGPDPVVVENSALKDIVRDAALFDAPTSYGFFLLFRKKFDEIFLKNKF